MRCFSNDYVIIKKCWLPNYIILYCVIYFNCIRFFTPKYVRFGIFILSVYLSKLFMCYILM